MREGHARLAGCNEARYLCQQRIGRAGRYMSALQRPAPRFVLPFLSSSGESGAARSLQVTPQGGAACGEV